MPRQMKKEQEKITASPTAAVHTGPVSLTAEEKKLLAALRDPIKGPQIRAIMRGSQRT